MPPADIALEGTMPFSAESEQAVLGAILLDEKAFSTAAEFLSAEDFYDERNRRIYRTMISLVEDEKPIRMILLLEELRRRSKVEEAGGPAYLASLTDGMPMGLDIRHYAETVREMSCLRQTIHKCHEAIERCYEREWKADRIIDDLQSSLIEIAGRNSSGGFVPMKDVCDEGYKEIIARSENPTGVHGIPSGLKDLDKITSGFQKTDLIFVGGRPSMGKTSFCLNVADHAAVDLGKNVAIVSMEMSRIQLYMRGICARADVDSYRVNCGMLTRNDWERINCATDELYTDRIWIDDKGGQSITQIGAKLKRLDERIKSVTRSDHGLDLIIIDYLQLAYGSSRRRNENRVQEVSEISAGLKNLAKALQVPVIAASQLSRKCEERVDKRPVLADLRESGSIEQDADLVLFIYRDEHYNPKSKDAGVAEIIIGKHRNGPTGTVMTAFNKQYTKFANLHREQ
jgi:replicative DNA helicase